jgi:hypothetical protein
MTADRLDGIGHAALPRIARVAPGHADVVPNWVVRVRLGGSFDASKASAATSLLSSGRHGET